MEYVHHYQSPLGGIRKKVRLLELEKADMSVLFVPTKGMAL